MRDILDTMLRAGWDVFQRYPSHVYLCSRIVHVKRGGLAGGLGAGYPTEREPPYVPPLFPSGVVQLLADSRVYRLVVGNDDQMRTLHACAGACD